MVSFKSQQILRSNAMGMHSSHSSYMQQAVYERKRISFKSRYSQCGQVLYRN